MDVKNALHRRFKPEQVARFGNIHLIYNSLRREHFEAVIRREIERVCRTTRESFGVKVDVTPAVRDLIYRNGVFPVQGVRPVFSSIADVLETNLAKLLFTALVREATAISIDYDHAARSLVGNVGAEIIRIPYTGRIDKIRDNTLEDKVANVAVHEAGHAVAYGVLFGLAPLQLTARVASTYVNGFTFPHQIYSTSQSLLAQVKVLLAGGIAEEVVFGKELASIGRNADRERATEMVVDFVRPLRIRSRVPGQLHARPRLRDGSIRTRTRHREAYMTHLVAETEQLLSEHRIVLGRLGAELAALGALSARRGVERTHRCRRAHRRPTRGARMDAGIQDRARGAGSRTRSWARPACMTGRAQWRRGGSVRCRCAGRAARGDRWDHRRGARSSWPAVK